MLTCLYSRKRVHLILDPITHRQHRNLSSIKAVGNCFFFASLNSQPSRVHRQQSMLSLEASSMCASAHSYNPRTLEAWVLFSSGTDEYFSVTLSRWFRSLRHPQFDQKISANLRPVFSPSLIGTEWKWVLRAVEAKNPKKVLAKDRTKQQQQEEKMPLPLMFRLHSAIIVLSDHRSTDSGSFAILRAWKYKSKGAVDW